MKNILLVIAAFMAILVVGCGQGKPEEVDLGTSNEQANDVIRDESETGDGAVAGSSAPVTSDP